MARGVELACLLIAPVRGLFAGAFCGTLGVALKVVSLYLARLFSNHAPSSEGFHVA